MIEPVFSSVTDMIESRGYLLDFQKAALIEDLAWVAPDKSQVEAAIDRVFYKLFGKGWNDLTTQEQRDIETAWKGK